MSVFYRVFFVFVSLALASCATQPVSVEQVASIRSIGVVGPDDPTHFALSIGNVGSAIAMGAAVGPGATSGVLAGSAASSGAQADLDQAMTGQGLKFGTELAQAISTKLIESGYRAEHNAAAHTKPSKFLGSYKQYNGQYDAVLDVIVTKFSYERRVWGPIAPSIMVMAKLVDPSSGRQLFKQTYYYDPSVKTFGITILRPPQEVGFSTREEVLANPDIVTEGLRAVIPMIADDISERLGQNPN